MSIPRQKFNSSGVGKQQLVEIAKAISRDVRILILDEPTSALNEVDSDNLLKLLRDLKENGVTCILISHKLRKSLKLLIRSPYCATGSTICTLDAHKGEVSEQVMIKHMVGREIDNIYPKRDSMFDQKK